MTDIAVTTRAELLLTRAPSAEAVREFAEKPLRMLLADWRPPVWEFWASWSHLLDNQIALANRLRVYIRDDGLTLREAAEAFAAVNDPAQAAEIRYKGELLAVLAKHIATRMARRKSIEAQEERQRQAERDRASAQPAEVRAAISRIGIGG